MRAAEPGLRPEISLALSRGVSRMLAAHNWVALSEAPLGNDRRADLLAISPTGQIMIVEIKSCLEDWRADQKWPHYLEYCDAFYFGVAEDFPIEVIDPAAGLIVADAFDGVFLREPAPRPALPGARRKAMTLAFARLAAARLARAQDFVNASGAKDRAASKVSLRRR